jgi:hypothetical protein
MESQIEIRSRLPHLLPVSASFRLSFGENEYF